MFCFACLFGILIKVVIYLQLYGFLPSQFQLQTEPKQQILSTLPQRKDELAAAQKLEGKSLWYVET